jgi:serine-type D-Ala-D-Ala endopeptidase (penicillin-binding protein 7)
MRRLAYRVGTAVILVAAGAAFIPSLASKPGVVEAQQAQTVQAKLDPFNFESVKAVGPKLNLRSALLVDYESGKVLYAKNSEMAQPIASLSKLVAAMVVLDNVTDFSKTIIVSKDDAYQSSFTRLHQGWELSLDDLLHASLMASDNRATRALARATSGTYDAFVEKMNAKCKSLGLKSTVFYDPTGLDSRNVSTAHEVALILNAAYKYPTIANITSTKTWTAAIKNRGRRRASICALRNTNRLMFTSPFQVLAGKTGFIEASAYCLATLLANDRGEKLTLVVLGAPGGSLRFKEAKKLATWGFAQN